jgi:hypothetical protein
MDQSQTLLNSFSTFLWRKSPTSPWIHPALAASLSPCPRTSPPWLCGKKPKPRDCSQVRNNIQVSGSQCSCPVCEVAYQQHWQGTQRALRGSGRMTQEEGHPVLPSPDSKHHAHTSGVGSWGLRTAPHSEPSVWHISFASFASLSPTRRPGYALAPDALWSWGGAFQKGQFPRAALAARFSTI